MDLSFSKCFVCAQTCTQQSAGPLRGPQQVEVACAATDLEPAVHPLAQLRLGLEFPGAVLCRNQRDGM